MLKHFRDETGSESIDSEVNVENDYFILYFTYYAVFVQKYQRFMQSFQDFQNYRLK